MEHFESDGRPILVVGQEDAGRPAVTDLPFYGVAVAKGVADERKEVARYRVAPRGMVAILTEWQGTARAGGPDGNLLPGPPV
jgi:hypothetical protein